MSIIVIRADGVDITADVIFSDATFTSAARGTPGTARFRLKDLAHEYALQIGKELTLDVDSVRVWGGYIKSIGRGYFFDAYDCKCKVHLVPRYHLIEAVDYNVLFNRRVLYDHTTESALELLRFPADTSDGEIISYYLTNFTDLPLDGVGTSKIESVGVASVDDFISGNAGQSFGDFVGMVTRLTGAVAYIDPDKNMVLTDIETANAPYGLSDDPNEFEVGCRELEILYNGTNLRNDVMIWGAGQGQDSVAFSRVIDATSVGNHWLWQAGEFNTGVWRQETVERIANSYVYGSPQNQRGGKDDAYSVRCTVFQPGFRVAQKVEVRSAIFGFDQVLPIRSVTVTFPTPTNAKFDLIISQDIDDPWSTFEFWFPDIDFGDIDIDIDIDIPEPVLPQPRCPEEGELPHNSAFSTWVGPPFEYEGRFRFHMADVTRVLEARFVLRARDSSRWYYVPGQIGVFSDPGMSIGFTNDINTALGCNGADALSFGLRVHDENGSRMSNSWLNQIGSINDQWISFKVRVEKYGILMKVWKDSGNPEATEPANWQYGTLNYDPLTFNFTDPTWLDTFEVGLSAGGASGCAFTTGARIEVDYLRMTEGWYTGPLTLDEFSRYVPNGMGLSDVPTLQSEGSRELWVVRVPVATDVSIEDQILPGDPVPTGAGRLVYEPTAAWTSGGPVNSSGIAVLEATINVPYNRCPEIQTTTARACEDAVRFRPPELLGEGSFSAWRGYYKVSLPFAANSTTVWVEGIALQSNHYEEDPSLGWIVIYEEIMGPLNEAGVDPKVYVCFTPGTSLYAES